MGSLNDKLDYLEDTKDAIMEALNLKGAGIKTTDTFRSYADKIAKMKGGDIAEHELLNTTGSVSTLTAQEGE